jgi:DNA-binding transcriptional ArsR family regulator
MPIDKTEVFKARENRVARLAKALAHPARVAILRELARRNECVCGEIVDALPLAQSTVSQHLRGLKEIGLVHGEIDGSRSCYCISRKAVQELLPPLEDFLAELRGCCQDESC